MSPTVHGDGSSSESESEYEDDDSSDVIESVVFWLHLSPESFPRLRRLYTRGVAIAREDFIPIQTLTHIHLSDCTFDMTMWRSYTTAKMLTMSQFLSLLVQSVNLEQLVLSRFHPRDNVDAAHLELLVQAPPLMPVSFSPKLRGLHISDIDFVIARFLSGMRVPSSTSVSLTKLILPSQLGENREDEDILRAPIHQCLPSDRTCLPILSEVNTVSVEPRLNEDDSCVIDGEVDERSITITARGYRESPHASDLATDIVEIFRGATVVNLSFHRIDTMSADGWRRMLAGLPSVERLQCRCQFHWSNVYDDGGQLSGIQNDACYTLVDALGAVDSAPASPVLVPHLATLTLDSHGNWAETLLPNSLMRCLQRRAEAGSRLGALHVHASAPRASAQVDARWKADYAPRLRSFAHEVEYVAPSQGRR